MQEMENKMLTGNQYDQLPQNKFWGLVAKL